MLYTFFEINAVTPELYEKWFSEASEQRRIYISKYKFEKDRLLSLCAYRLLCYALGCNGIEFIFNEHGKPELTGDVRQFNISHCDGCVAVGVSEDEIGVDAEHVKPYPEKIINRVFTQNEIAQIKNSPQPDITFFKLWTLKESYIKAIGKGLSFPLQNVEFDLCGEKIICSDTGFMFSLYNINSHVVSICEKKQSTHRIIRINEMDELFNK